MGKERRPRQEISRRNHKYHPYPLDKRSKRSRRPEINPNVHHPARVSYRYLNRHERAFQLIESKIRNPSIVIDDIVEVKNWVLENAYEAKKLEKINLFQDVREELLFHGTKDENIESICQFNFDWRLHGSNRGHRFGKGVNFSPSARYASNYSDNREYYKVMIVAKVLIAEVCQGNMDMSLPPEGFDTTQKGNNGIVIVKYEDNEFFPAYVVHYHFGDRHSERYNRHCNYSSRSADDWWFFSRSWTNFNQNWANFAQDFANNCFNGCYYSFGQ